MQPGLTVNQRYEILTEIGRGGMGIVYRGRSIALDRPVAIKVFNAAADADATKRAQREAHALAQVQHENLVRVFALEQEESGHLMMVFDFIDGKPLSDILSGGKLDLAETTKLFEQVCNGLTALHSNGFVHRDLKPSNLMVTEDLHLTIIDFGLAKSTDTSQKLTATGAVVGTPAYMSPEQFAGQPVSARSDLYSAACVLFEMLTGKPPYDYESPYLVAQAQVTERPPSIGKQVDPFFDKALAKNPQERFASASELFEAFQRTPWPSALEVQKSVKTKPSWIVPSIIAMVLTVVVVSITLLWKPEPPAIEEENIASEAETLDKLSNEFRKEGVVNDWSSISNHYEAGLQRIEPKIRKTPRSIALWNVYLGYSDALANIGKRTKAAQELEKAYAIGKLLSAKHGETSAEHLATAYDDNADYRQALRVFNEMVGDKGLGSMHGSSSCVAAHTLKNLEMSNELISAFGEKIEDAKLAQSREYIERRQSLAWAYMDVGEYDKAIAILKANQPSSEFMRTEDLERVREQDLATNTLAYALQNKNPEQIEKLFADVQKTKLFSSHSELRCAIQALVAATKNEREICRQNIKYACKLNYDHVVGIRDKRNWICQAIMYLGFCKKAAEMIQEPDLAKEIEHRRVQLRRDREEAFAAR